MLSDWLAVFTQRRTKADASLVVPSPLQALSVIYIQSRPRRVFLQPIQPTTKTIATGNIESSRTKPMHQPRPPSGSFPPTQHTTPSFQSTPSTKPSPPILQQPFQHCPPFTYVLLLSGMFRMCCISYSPRMTTLDINQTPLSSSSTPSKKHFHAGANCESDTSGNTEFRDGFLWIWVRLGPIGIGPAPLARTLEDNSIHARNLVSPVMTSVVCTRMNQSGHNPLSHCKWSRW
ncbi:hypothetical protein V1478_003154 [Vespula squamosa]|uniref:Uncharacterized protein n=1 Tax=Vespula squamosa TaxID=30214 RepID=A0ABD2BRV9_VESSQ